MSIKLLTSTKTAGRILPTVNEHTGAIQMMTHVRMTDEDLDIFLACSHKGRRDIGAESRFQAANNAELHRQIKKSGSSWVSLSTRRIAHALKGNNTNDTYAVY